MPRKKNYGQRPLSAIEGQLEAEATRKGIPRGMPSLELLKDYMAGQGLTEEDAEQMYDSWLGNGFRLKTGLKVHDWKAVVRTWKRNNFFASQKKAIAAMNTLEKNEERRRTAIKRMRENK
jgi:hypothetical protein